MQNTIHTKTRFMRVAGFLIIGSVILAIVTKQAPHEFPRFLAFTLGVAAWPAVCAAVVGGIAYVVQRLRSQRENLQVELWAHIGGLGCIAYNIGYYIGKLT